MVSNSIAHKSASFYELKMLIIICYRVITLIYSISCYDVCVNSEKRRTKWL